MKDRATELREITLRGGTETIKNKALNELIEIGKRLDHTQLAAFVGEFHAVLKEAYPTADADRRNKLVLLAKQALRNRDLIPEGE